MSESNGFTMVCKRHGDATYTLLQATAQKLPVRRDSDVAALVPWARSGDDCIRQIALDAIVAKIGYAHNRLSVPGMHDPEHNHFHSILVSTKAYLGVPGYDKRIFEGALIDTFTQGFLTAARKVEGQRSAYQELLPGGRDRPRAGARDDQGEGTCSEFS